MMIFADTSGLFALSNRNLSLVDCLSFEIMESREITHAFTFDKHFPENGITIAAFHDLDIE
jgi:predicted nucleic acid-binding protein